MLRDGILCRQVNAMVNTVPMERTQIIRNGASSEESYFGRKDTWAEEKLNHYNGEPPDTNHIYLDQTYAGIVKNSWVVLKDDHAAASYQIDDIVDLSKADFALSAKVSRLTVSPASEFQNFGIRTTTVFAQSNELKLARLPIEEPVSGPEIELVGWVDGLFEGQFIMVCGELETMRGVSACEYVTILTVDQVLESEGFTRITVTGLMNAYIRETVTINANVTAATHGETVQEVLGGGDASEPYQSFNLRQPPLTYVSAANANGAAVHAPGAGQRPALARGTHVVWPRTSRSTFTLRAGTTKAKRPCSSETA